MATKICIFIFLLMYTTFRVSSARSILNRNDTKTIDVNTNSRYFEDQFNATIECMRRQLIQGDPDSGLPSMDPWKINDMKRLNIDNQYLWTDLKLYNIVIKGLMTFETRSLDLNDLMKLNANFHFDRIHFRADYNGKINVLNMLNFVGKGTLDIELINLNIKTSTQYSLLPPLIDDYNITVALGRTKIRMTEIMEGNWSLYFSLALSYITTTLVRVFESTITETLNPIIMDFINSHIGHLPFLDFLALVSNENCPI